MLNLLISIIGQSYERINSTAVISTFKERADLIRDSTYLLQGPFSWFSFSSKSSLGSYLMIFNDVTHEENQTSNEPLIEKIS